MICVIEETLAKFRRLGKKEGCLLEEFFTKTTKIDYFLMNLDYCSDSQVSAL